MFLSKKYKYRKYEHKYEHKPSTDEVCRSIMLISFNPPSSLCELYLSQTFQPVSPSSENMAIPQPLVQTVEGQPGILMKPPEAEAGPTLSGLSKEESLTVFFTFHFFVLDSS